MIIGMVGQRQWGKAPTFGPRQWLRHRLLLKELSRLKSGQVLDAGCGEGRITHMLAGSGLETIGFDESREGVASAAANATGAEFARAGITSMPFVSDSFDALVSGDVLEHIEDDRAAVAEFFRVLKPGGLAVVSVPAHPVQWSIDDDWSGHKRRYESEDLIKIFRETGFQTEACYYWGWPVTWAYYRLLYIPMLKRRLGTTTAAGEPKGLSGSRLWGLIFRLVFLPDLALLGVRYGIGIIAVFRKPAKGDERQI